MRARNIGMWGLHVNEKAAVEASLYLTLQTSRNRLTVHNVDNFRRTQGNQKYKFISYECNKIPSCYSY